MSLREEIEKDIQAKVLEAKGAERAMLKGREVDVSLMEALQLVGVSLQAIRAAIGRLADEIDDLRASS